jgi:hypothetical protein
MQAAICSESCSYVVACITAQSDDSYLMEVEHCAAARGRQPACWEAVRVQQYTGKLKGVAVSHKGARTTTVAAAWCSPHT